MENYYVDMEPLSPTKGKPPIAVAEKDKQEYMSIGVALPILRKEGNSLVPDDDNLRKIFLQERLNKKPISIVSISGAFRKGKSFILNFFLRYLKRAGYSMKGNEWLGTEYEKLTGFQWSPGADACTVGILMWSEVFFVQKGNEEVGILLMDTQGLFDSETGTDVNTLIFALSTLISSVQIFNITQQVQENDLSFLQFFTEFAKASAGLGKSKELGKPFQRLVFLIRDWQNPAEYGFGMSGGNKYLEEKVLNKKCSNPELDSVRQHIRDSFQRTACCLLPYPGKIVAQYSAKRTFEGKLQDIDEDFRDEIHGLVSSVLSPGNLEIKTIGKEPVSNVSLLKYISECFEFATDGRLPKPANLMEARFSMSSRESMIASYVQTQAEARNLEIQRKCLDDYDNEMYKITKKCTYVTEVSLENAHQKASLKCMEEFESKTRFGDERNRAPHRKYLERAIERRHEELQTRNQELKVSRERLLMESVQSSELRYRNNMQKKAVGEKTAKHDELANEGVLLKRITLDQFHLEVDKSGDTNFTEKYATLLSQKIDAAYAEIRARNDEKLRMENEKDKLEKFWLLNRLRNKSKYCESMNKFTEKYIREKQLRIQHDVIEEKCVSDFFAAALKEELVTKKDATREQRTFFETLEQCYEVYKSRNDFNQEIVRKTLEESRNKALTVHDQHFRRMLETNYFRIKELENHHFALITKLIPETVEPYSADVRTDEIFEHHTAEAKKRFDQKLEKIKKWNEENRTILQKIFGKK